MNGYKCFQWETNNTHQLAPLLTPTPNMYSKPMCFEGFKTTYVTTDELKRREDPRTRQDPRIRQKASSPEPKKKEAKLISKICDKLYPLTRHAPSDTESKRIYSRHQPHLSFRQFVMANRGLTDAINKQLVEHIIWNYENKSEWFVEDCCIVQLDHSRESFRKKMGQKYGTDMWKEVHKEDFYKYFPINRMNDEQLFVANVKCYEELILNDKKALRDYKALVEQITFYRGYMEELLTKQDIQITRLEHEVRTLSIQRYGIYFMNGRDKSVHRIGQYISNDKDSLILRAIGDEEEEDESIDGTTYTFQPRHKMRCLESSDIKKILVTSFKPSYDKNLSGAIPLMINPN